MEQQEASMADEEENEEENHEVILDEPLIQNNQSITDDSRFYELYMACCRTNMYCAHESSLIRRSIN
ncbi:hypothetical protein RO3G_03815 [Rhizopus delemar RA 99-880]|uniref:Uncharacterized protein n=1 Tax=Rhizopus delemar (strain RA 99-880 / ATCC MYA-4621 / FGSC 9543 / NRRL 43880) TaxID=246409 RepID=I1BSD0_RHIO9|nr:hypothetical protein RO3G_03815 [Rhizopus delemar RA 99-880]|eukprot:EIE79110.1 hypothetical protein RO3G_03815 [Rhizopus delemar RA 99-880]